MKPVTRLEVDIRFDETDIPVGTLATDGKGVFFEYHAAFLDRNLHLSPFMLPLRQGLHHIADDLFRKLPGVFNDSLPDGWGQLLLHQHLKQSGFNPAVLGPLDELAMVGSKGIGALTYHPSHATESPEAAVDLDHYASASQRVLEGSTDDMLSELRAAAGSSAGARPKILVTVNEDKSRLSTAEPTGPTDEAWLIKFPGSSDTPDAGAIEFVYALMAKAAGISMSECHLFPSDTGPGYFGTRRFDRNHGKRLHVHSLSGLAHDDHRHPSFDYKGLLAATHKLTLNPADVAAMFRLAVFNVLAHNRDDHSKNISFLMDAEGRWSAAPAYDLTFSSGPNGFQSMSVMDEARQPTREHLRRLGLTAGIRRATINIIIEEVSSAIAEWPRLARAHHVTAANISFIGKVLERGIGVEAD
jgi:serine/threonine-protein kinase HipA